MNAVKLIWITPEAEKTILYCARVSNPTNQQSENTRLIDYLLTHQHWSPFEMANMCVEINTTRDIARQILRHRSFSFQEFSQRYAEPSKLSDSPVAFRAGRKQAEKNRQSSTDALAAVDCAKWRELQQGVLNTCLSAYREALSIGVARELARAILPEGLTPTRLYMNGTIRSWVHYVQLRTQEDTQLEHREIAEQVKVIMSKELPCIAAKL